MKTENYKILVLIIVAGLAVLTTKTFLSSKYSQKTEACNVAGIKINGYLGSSAGQIIDGEEVETSSDEIVHKLLSANENPNIKAVLVSIDSLGGNIYAGEEIANALRNHINKPSIAVIRSVGLSASYLAATGADAIYASRMSSVGDIGITQSYFDQTEKDKTEGYKYVEITSTKYKDVGNPSRPLSREEKELWVESVKKDHDIFVAEVAENRELFEGDVAEIANGLSYNGKEALEYGLIDGIRDTIFAINQLTETIGEKAVVCWE